MRKIKRILPGNLLYGAEASVSIVEVARTGEDFKYIVSYSVVMEAGTH